MANSLKSTIDDVDAIKPLAVGAEPSAFASTKVGGAEELQAQAKNNAKKAEELAAKIVGKNP